MSLDHFFGSIHSGPDSTHRSMPSKIGWITGCVLSEYLSLYIRDEVSLQRTAELGLEEHIRDEVSLNCHIVAKDCFIEVVGRWLSHEDGTVWSCKLNKMFMSLSQLTTGNSLHLHRLELMKVRIYVHT